MMRCLLAVTVIVLSCTTLTSWANAEDLLARNDEFLFRILYPEDWAQVTPRGLNVRVSITSEQGTGLATCNVLVKPVPELAGLSRREVESELPGLFTKEFFYQTLGDSYRETRFLYVGEDKLDNRPAGFAIFEHSYQTMGMKLDLTSLLAVTFTRLGMYQIGCSAVRDQFEKYSRIFTKIISSFSIEDYGG